MAKQRYVDWDGLVYYDGKIKSYISEKLDSCMKFMGDVSSRNELPDPSYENLNQVFKLTDTLNIETTDTDFKDSCRGHQYAVGTLVAVVDFDGVYLYDVLVQPSQNNESQDSEILNLEERVSSLEDNITDHQDRIETAENAITQLSESIDSTYAKKDDIPDISDFATKSEVSTTYVPISRDSGFRIYVSNNGRQETRLASPHDVSRDKFPVRTDAGNIAAPPLSHIFDGDYYASMSAVNNKITIALKNYAKTSDIPDTTHFITMSDVEDKGYLTEHQDISGKADKDHKHSIADISDYEVPSLEGYATEQFVTEAISNIDIPNVDNFITMSDVEEQGYLTEHQSLDHLATKDDLNVLENNIGYVAVDDKSFAEVIDETFAKKSEIPTDYITESDLDAKGYLTEHQSLENYVTKDKLELKSDAILFKQDKLVTVAIGNFAVGDSVKDLTIAEIITRILGLTDSTSPENPDGPQGIIATIIANELPIYSGTDTTGLAANDWNEISLSTAEHTESGFYSEDDRNGYQLVFIGNTELDAQTFAIPQGAKIIAAYKYDLGGTNTWLLQETPPSFEWIEAGTTTVEVDGATYTYDVYEYNVGDMGDALIADEYWRIEIGE